MSNHDDLQPIIDQLRANRPEATALELDAIKQRVRARASHPARRRTRRAQLMKSRVVILTMLVFGMLLSTAGAGLAVTGLSGNDSASTGQYAPGTHSGPPGTPTPTSTTTPTGSTTPSGGGGVLGDTDESPTGGGSSPSGGGTSPSGGSAPSGGGTSPSGGVAGETSTQPARQVDAGASTRRGSSPPFTWFAGSPIPVRRPRPPGRRPRPAQPPRRALIARHDGFAREAGCGPPLAVLRS